jgi:hypothetical protein
LHDTDADIVYVPVDEVVELDEDGHFSIDLVASQGAGANPDGVGYRVWVVIEDTTPPQSYRIVLDEGLVSPIDLSDLPPAGSSTEWFYPQMVPTPLPVLGAVIDGGGEVITIGNKRGPVSVPVNSRILGWRAIGNITGDIVVDVRACAALDYPTSEDDSITGDSPITVEDSILVDSNDVEDWCGGTAELSAGDVLEFEVLSVASFTWVRIELFIETS